MGYPGRTNRYLTSHGVKMAIDKDQPTRVDIRGKKLEIMKTQMDQSDAVRIQYASNYAQVSNYWKYFIGQSEQLTRNKVYDKKIAIENEFAAWVAADEKRQAKYGNVLKDMDEAYSILGKYINLKVYYSEAIASLTIPRFISRHIKLYTTLKSDAPDPTAIKGELDKIAPYVEDYFASFDLKTETNLMSEMLFMYHRSVDASQHPKELISIFEANAGDDNNQRRWARIVENSFAKSVFTDTERYKTFAADPKLGALTSDDFFSISYSLLTNFRELVYSGESVAAQAKLDKANRLFISGLREMYPDKNFYPNANSTLRLTYGTIQKYKSADKNYNYFTDIESMMKKEDPNHEDFIIPAKLKELYEKKDYGRYGQDGTLWINFISNNDITGGNSGSPVINGKGQLIGVAFDGNWEAMSGDIAFEPELQRTISCDIRYVLFVIDKYAGATRLIEEMTIVE
jgi:hypothetical protein